MDGSKVKFHCSRTDIVNVAIIFGLLTVASSVCGEAANLEFQITECSKTGGMLIENRCVCKPGYTGAGCDVYIVESLFEDTTVIETSELSFEVQAIDDRQLSRLRRQSMDLSISGSGDMTTAEAPTTPSPSCPPGQVVNSLAVCVSAITLQGQLTIGNRNFTTELNNMTSSVSIQLIDEVTNAVNILLDNTTFNNVQVIGFSAGSVIAEVIFAFEGTATSSNDILNILSLLQSRLLNSNSTLNFLTVSAIDADECSNQPSPCQNNTDCTNTLGSFKCDCKPGYEDSSNGCLRLCDKLQCKNKGTCVYENGTTSCICPAEFSGELCEVDSFPFRQATIAVSIVLGVLLFIAIVLILFVLCHKARSKQKASNDLPLATGFKATERDDFSKVYDNPQAVSDDENRASLRIDEEQHDSDNFPNTTSTFKPEESAAKADEDDKL